MKNTRRTRMTRLAAVTMTTALVAAACGGSDDATDTAEPADTAETDDTADASEAVVVSFVGPEAPEAMEPVIAAYEAENPNVDIQYESVPFNDLNSIIQTRLGSGDADPDVFTVDSPRTEAFVARGLLAELDVETDGIVQQSAVDAATIGDGLYALPISTSSQLLYYNTDLLEAAGLPIPSEDPADRLTWEALVDNATEAQEAGAEFGFMFDQVSRYYQLQPLAESAGGGSGVESGTLEIDITNDGWVAAMQFYGGLFEDGLAPRGVSPEQSPDLFANGQVAYWVGGPWWLPMMADAEGLNFGVAPHPYFDGGAEVTPTGAWSWGVSATSDVSEEAIQFIEFAALDPVGALATAQGFPLPPANNEVFTTYYAENQVVPGVEELISFELANTAVARPRTQGYVEFEEFMGTMFEDIRNGADPATALADAESAIEQAWSRLN